MRACRPLLEEVPLAFLACAPSVRYATGVHRRCLSQCPFLLLCLKIRGRDSGTWLEELHAMSTSTLPLTISFLRWMPSLVAPARLIG